MATGAGVPVGVAYVDILPRVGTQFGAELAAQVTAPVQAQAGEAAAAVEGKIGGAFKSVAAIAATTFVGVKLVGFVKGAVDAAETAKKVAADTNAAIASTGGVANVTAAQVDALSKSIARKTGVDHEQIATSENLLLTFQNIHDAAGKNNDIFDRATQAAVDLAARFGGDVSSAARQLGKALNEPTQGLTALQRAGVQFSQSQKDQIAAFVKSGDVLSAQKIILDQIAVKVGGSAAAQSTAAGRMSESWRQLQEQIGSALLPVIEKLQGALQGLFDWFRTAPAWVKTVIEALAGVATAIAAIVIGVKAWELAQIALNAVMDANPIVLIAGAIVGLGVALYEAYKHSETFRDVVKAAFQAVVNAVGDSVGWILDAVAKFIGALATAAEAATHLPVIGDKFKGVADTLRGAQGDVQGWADALHKGIDITGQAAGAAGTLADKTTQAKDAVGGLGDQSGTTTAKLPLLTAALVAAGVAVQGVNDAAGSAPQGLDAWAQDVSGKIGGALDPLKNQAQDLAQALSFSDVKKELESGQAWEADYAKLGAAAKAGLEPAKTAAKQTAASLGDILGNVTANNKALQTWLDDLKTLGSRQGGQFQPLAAELAKLGPDAAAAVHQAVTAPGGTLDKLQNAFADRAKLMGDDTITGLEDSLGGPGVVNVGELAISAFGKGWRDQIPEIAKDTTQGLHDALVGSGPVLSPDEARKYLGIPYDQSAPGAPSPAAAAGSGFRGPSGPAGLLTPPPPTGLPAGPTPADLAAQGWRAGSGPWGQLTPPPQPAPTVGTVSVYVQTNADPAQIASTVGDTLAWRLAPRPLPLG